MRELPEGIDNNAENLNDVYAGVEKDEVRFELKTLAVICAHNEIITAVLSAVTGLEFDTHADVANYIYQNTDAQSSRKIAICEILSQLGNQKQLGDLSALLA